MDNIMALNEEFEAELSALINKHSVDDALNTPDFILAESIVAELKVQRIIQQKRANWFSAHGILEERKLKVELV
jgi:hypothetical protein